MAGSVGERAEMRPVRIDCDAVSLTGDLVLPAGAMGLVAFAHGSGSSRRSPRNRYVAGVLHAGGLATLLFDLLTPEEEEVDARTRHLRFDIELLAKRLVATTDWLLGQDPLAHLPLGYFGASTGAAAALIAAARRPGPVAAVVSRGGRPDLAGSALAEVRAPTLLIVGGLDDVVIELNQKALAQIRAEKAMQIVAGATHLFEEPGTLEQVAVLARDWFRRHLVTPAPGGPD
jgi:dienelactone hydrolase